MANEIIPTLDTTGWVKSTSLKLWRAYSYFITSNYTQSDTFRGSIVSLKYLIGEYGYDLTILESKLEEVLTEYLENKFDDVTVNVTMESIDEQNHYDLKFYIEVTENGKVETLEKVVNIRNNLIVDPDEKINDYYNQGLE